MSEELTTDPPNAMSLPYFHPSTVVFVDDNDQFLQDLDVRLPEYMPYLLRHDASSALAEVNRYANVPTLAHRCFSKLNGNPQNRHPGVIQFDVGLIQDEVSSVSRFDRVSVVVVDYAMPIMSGLEFCAAITDPFVKKILLTGAADEKLAVRAFNDGLIDRFVLKNDKNSIDAVLEYVNELQIACFRRQQLVLAAALSWSSPPFMRDARVTRFIQELATERALVEHYLVGDPPGFLFLTASGEVERLAVMGPADFDQQADMLRRFGAPDDLITAVSRRQKLVCMYDSLSEANAADYPWSNFTSDTVEIQGSSGWWISIIAEPPVTIDFDPQSSSLNTHLARLDAI